MTMLTSPKAFAFSSREHLRLIESFGLTGNWSWTFATDEHAWSQGLFRLLGLEPGLVRPSYERFLSLVHPEDRLGLATSAQVMQEGMPGEHTLRVIRPNGDVRVLSTWIEIYFAPDGRPRGAAGVVLDVTDRDVLARAEAAERRRQWALFEQAQVISAVMNSTPIPDPPREVSVLTGKSMEELRENPGATIVPEQQARGAAMSEKAMRTGTLTYGTYDYALAAGDTARFWVLLVPLHDARGTVTQWYGQSAPTTFGTPELTAGLKESLEQQITSPSLRAARALLGWSMHDLARASGLSFSTVRRLEEGGEGAASRSRHTAIAALRRAGIRFSLLDGGTVAVGKA
ncbi:PAS domain-containing protein [Methylobacterium sp. A54F]